MYPFTKSCLKFLGIYDGKNAIKCIMTRYFFKAFYSGLEKIYMCNTKFFYFIPTFSTTYNRG